MKITIDVLENENNKDNLEYLISDTSNEAITAEHRGIDRAVKGRILAQTLDIDFRTLQSRIEYLHKQGCAIGSIDNGYFIPVNEYERRAGIIKKQRTGIAINNAVNGYTLAELDWIDQLFKEE
ncbi:MAG: hypothetical protein L0H99_12735 [Loigolactobacillus coryniformis]|uniref:hypothetical protein n=1 Tax=Loigolactobacillus coryniformis TaxID=1610 RepID=UPI0026476E0D|nr:hypothetical protein [Loigolactobacillus coryniformis]MDN5954749.1 hypothetical protein [Loigolactobacillus coryniformis]